MKLQGLKIQVMAEQGALGGKGRIKAEVVESRALEGKEDAVASAAPHPGPLPEEREKTSAALELVSGGSVQVGGNPNGASSENEKQRLLLVLREVTEIVNRGGSTEEKVLELRARLAEQASAFNA